MPTSGFEYIRFKSQTSNIESGKQTIRKPKTDPQVNQEFMAVGCVVFFVCILPVIRLVAADGSKHKSNR